MCSCASHCIGAALGDVIVAAKRGDRFTRAMPTGGKARVALRGHGRIDALPLVEPTILRCPANRSINPIADSLRGTGDDRCLAEP